MKLKLPDGMTASVQVPTVPGAEGPVVDGRLVEAELDGNYWILKQDIAGEVEIQVR